MGKAEFRGVEVLSEQGMDLAWLSLYPIFTPEFLDLMGQLLPEDRQGNTILAVFIRGWKD